jgi:hypothetical protein
MPVELGKTREFARATGSTSAAYLQGTDPVVPITFLTTLRLWDEGAEAMWVSGLDPGRTLHAEQEFVFHGPPPRAGDMLTLRTEIVGSQRKQGRRGGELTLLTVRTSFCDPAGELVAEAISTAIEVEEPPRV